MASVLDRTLEVLRAEEVRLRQEGLRHLSVFGSVARGEARQDSDIDIAVELDPERPYSLFRLEELRLRLSDLLGRKVDLAEVPGLREEARVGFEEDRVSVF